MVLWPGAARAGVGKGAQRAPMCHNLLWLGGILIPQLHSFCVKLVYLVSVAGPPAVLTFLCRRLGVGGRVLLRPHRCQLLPL
jgi:hypothetical protein